MDEKPPVVWEPNPDRFAGHYLRPNTNKPPVCPFCGKELIAQAMKSRVIAAIVVLIGWIGLSLLLHNQVLSITFIGLIIVLGLYLSQGQNTTKIWCKACFRSVTPLDTSLLPTSKDR